MGKPETGSISFDIDARHRHVIGDGPRIAPVPNDQVGEDAWALVNTIRASAGAPPTDDMPEYMRTMIKHPALFRCNMDMGNTLYNGLIPPRERELAVLRCGWLCRAPFEFGVHVPIAKRVGVTAEDVERAILGSSAAGWSEHEAAILRGVEELVADQALSDATWDTLAKTWDEQQLIEFPMMIGQYISTAIVQNTLRIKLDEGNPGLTNR